MGQFLSEFMYLQKIRRNRDEIMRMMEMGNFMVQECARLLYISFLLFYMSISTILSWCICILVSSINSKMLLLYLIFASSNFRCDVKGRSNYVYSIGLE